MWMDCPLKAKFHYVDGLSEPQNAYAAFGSVVHHCMEIYNETNDVEHAVEMFQEYWTHPERLGVEPEVWPKYTSFSKFMQDGITALRNFDDQYRFSERTVLATEHRFLVPFGRHKLTGAIDCLQISEDRRGSVLEIVDYKTNRKRPFANNLRLNIQFSIYDLASRHRDFWFGSPSDPDNFPPMENGEFYWEMHRNLPRKNTWWGLLQGKEFDAGPRDEADFLRLYRVVNEVEKALEHNVFVPNISGDSCTWCPYQEPCGLPIDDVRGYTELDEDHLR